MLGIDIDSFIDLMELSQLDAIELSEILWLSKYMKTDNRYYRSQTQKKLDNDNTSSIPKDNSIDKPPVKETRNIPKPTEEKIEDNDNISLGIDNGKDKKNQINISHKGFFEGSQKLYTYLVDFKEKKDSKKIGYFDEDKTVEYRLSTGILNPFFKPKKEKYFILYLFIDCGQSMEVWEEMSREYQKLLTNVKVFKEVQVIYADTNKKNLKFFKDKKQTKAFNIKEITNFYNDKLIFLITDMLSLSWKRGNAFKIFAKLYKYIPLYIIQVLPYRLWRSTELKKASITTLNTKKPYPTSKSYNSEIDYMLKILGGDNNSLRLPLVNFELSYLKVIGKTLKAKDGNRIDGAILNFNNMRKKVEESSDISLSAYEKVERFFSNSSPQA